MNPIFLIIAFIVSRIPFINPGPVFFDSPEYLTRLSDPNLWHALTTGHLPLHAGYILLLWPPYHFSPSLIVPFQILLGLAGIICFYKITKNKLAAILVSLLPLLWISQVTVMMEAVYIPLFFISAYFLTRRHYVLFSFLFSLSAITHLSVLLWLPLLVYLHPKALKWICFSLLLTFLGYWALTGHPFLAYTSKLGEHVNPSFLPFLRNILIPTLRNNTNLIVILAAISLFINRKSLFINQFLWLAPIIITDQWWDSLFFGRHALIASFGLAYLVSLLLARHKFFTSIVITYLLITSLPALALLHGPIPYLQEAKQAAALPPGGIYVTSHFARPQLSGIYRGTTIFVNEPGWESLPATVSALYVSSSARSDPYGLYSGPYLHLLSVSSDTYYSPRRLDYHDPITKLWFRFLSFFTF